VQHRVGFLPECLKFELVGGVGSFGGWLGDEIVYSLQNQASEVNNVNNIPIVWW